ncbi:HD domain-containing protein [Streptomyces sp. NPDC008240]|uniref:HD domain-containing protein n=1 Tax=Streptomyces sp. NPDC008240 TaxID=3364822 RepID=UPI0036E3ECDA
MTYDPIPTVDALMALLADRADVWDTPDRSGDPVDILDHGRQVAAVLAERHPEDEELQVAGLVHDIGHHLVPGDEAGHGAHAATAVEGLLGPRVARLVALHIPAKRYLAAADPHLAPPPGYETEEDVLGEARQLMAQTGGSVTLTTEPIEAVGAAQAVYAEVWVPMDRHRERAERTAQLAAYRVDDTLLSHAPRDAVAMHCRPAARGHEIASEVLAGPRSLVRRQAANRLPTAQAVLHTLVGTARRRRRTT